MIVSYNFFLDGYELMKTRYSYYHAGITSSVALRPPVYPLILQ